MKISPKVKYWVLTTIIAAYTSLYLVGVAARFYRSNYDFKQLVTWKFVLAVVVSYLLTEAIEILIRWDIEHDTSSGLSMAEYKTLMRDLTNRKNRNQKW